VNRMLGTVGDNDLVGSATEPVLLLVQACDRCAEFRDAAGGRVMRMAVLHRFESGAANVFPSGKIRLTKTEIEDVNSLPFQLACLRRSGERGGWLHRGSELGYRNRLNAL